MKKFYYYNEYSAVVRPYAFIDNKICSIIKGEILFLSMESNNISEVVC